MNYECVNSNVVKKVWNVGATWEGHQRLHWVSLQTFITKINYKKNKNNFEDTKIQYTQSQSVFAFHPFSSPSGFPNHDPKLLWPLALESFFGHFHSRRVREQVENLSEFAFLAFHCRYLDLDDGVKVWNVGGTWREHQRERWSLESPVIKLSFQKDWGDYQTHKRS